MKKRYLFLLFCLIGGLSYLFRSYFLQSSHDEMLLRRETTSQASVAAQRRAASYYAHTQSEGKAKGIGVIDEQGKVVFSTLQSEDIDTSFSPEEAYDIKTATQLLRSALEEGQQLEIDGKKYISKGLKGAGANGEVYFIEPMEGGKELVIKVYKLKGERTNLLKKIDLNAEAIEEYDTHYILYKALPANNIRKEIFYVAGALPVLIQPRVYGETVKKTIEEGLFNEVMGLEIYLMLMRLAEHHLGVRDLNPANIMITKENDKIVPIIIDAHLPQRCENYWNAYEETVVCFLQKLPNDHGGLNALYHIFKQAKQTVGTSMSQPENIPEEQYVQLKKVWSSISEGFGPEDMEGILEYLEEKVKEEAEQD